MVNTIRFAQLVPAALFAFVLSSLAGCEDKNEKTHKSATAAAPAAEGPAAISASRSAPPASSQEYNCIDTVDQTAEERFWCLARQAFGENHSQQPTGADKGARAEFIQSWMHGLLDAGLGLSSRLDKLAARPTASEAYQAGYGAVLKAHGALAYDCSGGEETDNEYRDRWCEAAAAYGSSQQGEAGNSVLRAVYINGYLAGRSVALTLPTAMESLFSGEAPGPDAKRSIDEPANDAPRAVKTFHRGFQDGFQGMIDAVQDSMEQMMEQMRQMPGNMSGLPGIEGGPDTGGG